MRDPLLLGVTTVLLAACSAGCGSVEKPAALRGTPTASVDVRVSSPQPVELWSDERVCRSPCEKTVEVQGKTFEVRVPELPDSPSFELPETDRDLLVQVRPSRHELVGAGAALGVLGGGATIAGGGAAVLDLAGNADFQSALGPGLITAASGLAVVAGGIVCAALSGTSVTLKELAEAGTFRF